MICIRKLLFGTDQADPATAPACTGLEHDRIPDPFGCPFCLRSRSHGFCSRDDRKTCSTDQLFQFCLVAEALHAVGIGADEHQPVLSAGTGKMRILGKKSVAGMDRLRTCQKSGADDLIFIQIAFRCFGPPDAVALIGERDVQGVLIRLGIHSDRGHAHFLAGPNDSDSDLAAVGDQYF